MDRLFRQSDIAGFETCAPNVTSGSARVLTSANKPSGNDVCLLLNNEYHGRDLTGFEYCGGRDEYYYPTRAQLTSYLPLTAGAATSHPVIYSTGHGRAKQLV